MKKKEKKPKKGFLEGYKSYNPEKEGFGSPEEWQDCFSARMGFENAKKVLDGKDPYAVLEVSRNSTFEEIKRAYRKKAMQFHPDRNIGDKEAEENFKKVAAAFEVLDELMNPRKV